MGIRSDVGIAIKYKILTKLSDSLLTFLRTNSSRIYQNEEGMLYEFKCWKWREDYSEIKSLYNELDDFDEEGYLIIQACTESPGLSSDFGGWWDNPWKLSQATSVSLHIEEEPRKDSNVMLEELLRLSGKATDGQPLNEGERDIYIYEIHKYKELFLQLHKWIENGGKLPKGWQND